MKKILLALMAFVAVCTSCHDTESYADIVDKEKGYISKWMNQNPYNIDFSNVITHDDEWLSTVTKKVLQDSIHPSEFIELGQWYTFSNGDFKRYYFRINSWGNDHRESFYDSKITSDEFKKPNGKTYASSNVMVRYDSLFLISGFDYKKPESNLIGNNLDPNSYELIYNWRSNYYATQYYSMYYSTNSSYQCTSGGLGFPCRFLWFGGEASMIVPFSLTDQEYSSAYYTMYYGNVRYTKPNYLPQ